MIEHLSTRQIEEWLIGDRPPEVREHLTRCPACTGEVNRAAEPLMLFGAAVREWGEQIPASRTASARAPRRTGIFGWRTAAAFAALLAIVAVPAYRYHALEQQAVASAAAIEDEILLQQVATGISRSVPAPMEPLAQLMSSDSIR